jgi:predicted nucleic acid-binding protein
MIVSDAGPIIIFSRIGRLFLLRDITVFLLITEAVHDEIVLRKAACQARPRWLKPAGSKKPESDRSIMDSLPNVLHQGERAAIALAKERSTQLLIDSCTSGRSSAWNRCNRNVPRPDRSEAIGANLSCSADRRRDASERISV